MAGHRMRGRASASTGRSTVGVIALILLSSASSRPVYYTLIRH